MRYAVRARGKSESDNQRFFDEGDDRWMEKLTMGIHDDPISVLQESSPYLSSVCESRKGWSMTVQKAAFDVLLLAHPPRSEKAM